MLQKTALVVGIDDYADEEHDLPSCLADARAMADLLRRRGFSVSTLLDDEAQLDRVRGALGKLFDAVDAGDRVVFFYSGHGARTVRQGVQTESLVMQDFQLLHDDDVVDAARHLPPGALTIVLDSCFSGGLAKEFGGPRRKSLRFLDKEIGPALAYRPFGAVTRPNIGSSLARVSAPIVPTPKSDEPTLNGLLFSACRENETAAASTPNTDGQSAFTFALLAALAERGPSASPGALLPVIAQRLNGLGLVQAPQLHPPAAPIGMEGWPLFGGGEVVRGVPALPITESYLLQIVLASVAALAAMH